MERPILISANTCFAGKSEFSHHEVGREQILKGNSLGNETISGRKSQEWFIGGNLARLLSRLLGCKLNVSIAVGAGLEI